MSSRTIALLLILGASFCRAQSVDIYPEFRRVDPFGKVVPSDRGLVSREVLSPGVARNGFASFHIVVSVPPKESYFLYVVPNPLTACRVDMYKEHFVKTAQGWIPDALEELHRLPDFGVMPDPDETIEGQTTRVYLLDLWLPPNADVARFRLEVQLKVGNWFVRPMEVRVTSARYPDVPVRSPDSPPAVLPPVEQGADASALSVMAGYFAGNPLRQDGPPQTVREVIRRNAIQDMALAGSLDPGIGGPGVIANRSFELFRSGIGFVPRIFGAEWYLRLRDYLLNQASAR